MPGSFDFNPYAVPLSGVATPVGVFRYDPPSGYVLLPNVRCNRIEYREGPQPPAAHFSYMLDDADAAIAYPAQFEQLWPMAAGGPYVVQNDDRLVVLATAPSGGVRVLFDGFAQVPEVELSESSQRIAFLAVGVAIRCWDSPIGGRYERHADDPKNGKTVSVDLPTRFNPDGQPNCTPDSYDVNESTSATSYPVFLDPRIDRQPDPRTYWTLGKFVRYILSVQNDGSYIQNPDFTQLDALLQARAPLAGSGFVDPDQSGNYTAADVVIRDFDSTNMAWPEALELQLGYAGFGMRFVTGEDGAGNPWHTIEFYRKDAAGQGSPLDLHLPPRGSMLDPAACNVAALHLARDARAIVNAITMETQQRRVEVSIVLAPGFSPQAGDETAGNRLHFLRANLSTASGDVRRKYRYYVADEAGDGHCDVGSSAWSTTALDLSPIFPNDSKGNLTYVKRLRPGASTLVSRDSLGHPLKAQLALSRDYTGKAPAVWDGTGTWQPITGGWELLEDRLGIFVIVEDPESWPIGIYTGTNPQEASQTLRGITSQANPSAPNTRFFLRLTTVIEDDLMLPAVVPPRPASPTVFTVRRRVDARDHFALETVSAGSLYNPGTDAVTVRDDTQRAIAHAEQLRAAHEFPPLAGSVTIPSLITAYRVGDRIGMINGRNISLQTNLGSGQGEPATYPVIVALSWDFTSGGQATILELADRRAEM
jgi:hypothetical protein